jgi:hypothetical protein
LDSGAKIDFSEKRRLCQNPNKPSLPRKPDSYPHSTPWPWSIFQVGEPEALHGNAGSKELQNSPPCLGTQLP